MTVGRGAGGASAGGIQRASMQAVHGRGGGDGGVWAVHLPHGRRVRVRHSHVQVRCRELARREKLDVQQPGAQFLKISATHCHKV
jgi:hypothetical protein